MSWVSLRLLTSGWGSCVWQGEMVVEISIRAKVLDGAQPMPRDGSPPPSPLSFASEIWAPNSPAGEAPSGSRLEALEAVEFATARTEGRGVAPPQAAPGSPSDRLAEVEAATGGFSTEETILSPAQRYRRDRAASQGGRGLESPNPFLMQSPDEADGRL